MFGINKEKWEELNGLNTASEIYQQPDLWLEVLSIIESNKDEIDKFMNKNLNKKGVRIIFSGAGTSAYVGEIVAPYLDREKKHSYQAIGTTDIVANPTTYLEKDIPTIMVSFARSGNSPESVATYELANEIVDDISHVFITCNAEGKLADISKTDDNILLLLMPEESNDKGFAMTSSFSCMTLTAGLIFDMENIESNKKQVVEMETIAKDVLNEGYKNLETLLDYDYERIVYLGSDSLYGLAKESALKLLELTRGQIIAHSETVLGFRHGPKSIVNDHTLIFVYISEDDYSRKYDLDILNELYHDIGDHKVISISKQANSELEERSHHQLSLMGSNSNIENQILLSLLYALYAQVFSLLASVKSGVQPDNPNPSGSVNRVVQGVIIHQYK